MAQSSCDPRCIEAEYYKMMMMSSARLGVAIAVVVNVLFLSSVSGKNAVPTKRYKVDLDVDAEKRWIPILKDYEASTVKNLIDSMLSDYVHSRELQVLAKLIAGDLDNYLMESYASEIRGIAKFYNVEVGDIVLENLAYDATAWGSTGMKACTSIVTNDKDGGLLHARNLDYDYPDILRNITIDVEFHRGGKIHYVATTYVGYVGVLTGAKPNAFSISADERDTGFWWENLLFAIGKSWPTLILTRHVLESAPEYQSALRILTYSKTIAPIYYIVGGMRPYEGAIVVRDRLGAVNVTTMLPSSEFKWYLVETNYDPWTEPPASDDRRDVAIQAMEEVGEDRLDSKSLYKVLSTPKVLNVHTTYTTIMSTKKISEYQTMIRWDHPPK